MHISWETTYKKIESELTKSGEYYNIYTTMVWKKFPVTRSTDVFGMIYKNYKIVNRNMYMFYALTSTGTTISTPLSFSAPNYKYYTTNSGYEGGWAGLYTLPTNMQEIDYLTFEMESTGYKKENSQIIAQSSYQHSQDYISKTNVFNNLEWSWDGIGGVFDFNNFNESYDKMQGVRING